MTKKFNVLDIFSGAGGFSKGFESAGFSIRDFAEFDKWAIETYKNNINVINKERGAVDLSDVNEVNSLIKENKNKIGILIGGFPCQGYSLIGKREKDDPRNTLYKPTLKIINEIKPKIFVLENVTGILSMNNGRDVSEIMNFLKKEGWFVRYEVLDSSNFGVPQSRKRVFFIGTCDKKIDVNAIWENLLNRNDDRIPISKVLKNVEKIYKNDPNHEKTNHTESMKRRLVKLKEGQPLYPNFQGGTKKLWWNKVAPTIRDNHGGTFIHPMENRYLTAREIALLQTFPEKFIFKGPKTKQLKQIGNAVPVELSKQIAEELKRWL